MDDSRASSFLSSPLATWVRTFEHRHQCDSLSVFANGVMLNEIMHEIDPRKSLSTLNHQVDDSVLLRAQNLGLLMQSIQDFYNNDLQQLLIMQLPDMMAIAHEPESDYALDQLEKVLILLMGCAVQCESKAQLIERITALEANVQNALVQHLQMVVNNPDNVYSLESAGFSSKSQTDLENDCQCLEIRLKRVARERNSYYWALIESSQECSNFKTELQKLRNQPPPSPLGLSLQGDLLSGMGDMAANQEHIQELHSRIQALTDQLDLTALSATEAREQLENAREKMHKLQQEKQTMIEDVQWAHDNRDVLDTLRHKAQHADQLEGDIAKYRRKLEDMEHVKKLLKELKEQNGLLLQSKSAVEEEVVRLTAKTTALDETELENTRLRLQVAKLQEEKEEDVGQIASLVQKNACLQADLGRSNDNAAELNREIDRLRNCSPSGAMTPFEFNTSFTVDNLKTEDLQTRLTEVEQDKEELEKSNKLLQEASMKASSLEQRNKELYSQQLEYQQDIALAKEELRREREKSSSLEEERSRHQDELQRAVAQREHELMAQLIEEKRNFLELEQKMDDEIRRSAQLSEEQVSELNTRLQQTDKEKLVLAEEKHQLKEEKEQLMDEKQQLRKDKLQLMEERKQLTEDKLHLIEELSEVREASRRAAASVNHSLVHHHQADVQTEPELLRQDATAWLQAAELSIGGEQSISEDNVNEEPTGSSATPMTASFVENTARTPQHATVHTQPVSASFTSAVISPQIVASKVLMSTPASRIVSSERSTPTSSPMVGRSVVDENGVTHGEAIVPAAKGVMQLVRGLVETVGTPTQQQNTSLSSSNGSRGVSNLNEVPSQQGVHATESPMSSPGPRKREFDIAMRDWVDVTDPETLRTELVRLRREYVTAEDQLRSVQRQLQGELAQMDSENRNLQRQLHATKLEVNELEDDLRRVRKQLKSAHQQNNSMEEELVQVRQQLQTSRLQLQEVHNQLRAVGGELHIAQNHVLQYEQQNAQLEATNEALSQRLDTVEMLNRNYGEEVRMVMDQMKALLAENSELRTKNEEATDKFRDHAKSLTDHLGALEEERGRLSLKLTELQNSQKHKKRSAIRKIAGALGKKFHGDKHKSSNRTDGSEPGVLGSMSTSHSMPRIQPRDRAETMPSIHLSSMPSSTSVDSFPSTGSQGGVLRKVHSTASSLNDAATGGSSQGDDEEDQISQGNSASNGARGSPQTPGWPGGIASQVLSLQDFLKETDKTPGSRRKFLDTVMANATNTPQELRRTAHSTSAIQPRRDFSEVDAPSFLESLKATPSRHVTGQSFLLEQDLDLLPIEEPVQGSAGSRSASQASSDVAYTGSEHSAGIGGPAGSGAVVSRSGHVSSGSSVETSRSSTSVGAGASRNHRPLSRAQQGSGRANGGAPRTSTPSSVQECKLNFSDVSSVPTTCDGGEITVNATSNLSGGDGTLVIPLTHSPSHSPRPDRRRLPQTNKQHTDKKTVQPGTNQTAAPNMPHEWYEYGQV